MYENFHANFALLMALALILVSLADYHAAPASDQHQSDNPAHDSAM